MNEDFNRLDPPMVVAVPIAAGEVPLEPTAIEASSRSSASRVNPLAPPSGYSLVVTNIWLSASLMVLSLASVLTIGPDRRVYIPGLGVPIPETCTLYARFGIECPGCGLTRSFIHFADGNLRAGLSLNWASIVIFLFFIAQIPAAVGRLVFGRSSPLAIAWTRFNEIALIVLPSLTVIQWLARFALS